MIKNIQPNSKDFYMNIVILDAKTLGDDLDLTPLKKFGKLVVYETTNPSETYERIANATIVITNKVMIGRLHMQRTPLLKLICVAATGMNNIDLKAAKEIGIEVKNVAGYSTQSVVQHTFAMLFYLIENLCYYDKFVKHGEWSHSGIFTDVSRPFFEIAGKSWGIIGFGAIGQEVARVATAFGANISYHSTSGQNSNTNYPQKSLESLLRESDIVSIHAPLNDTTHDLISAETIAFLKHNAILLNLGRGGIVNETALASALNECKIYAGIDVIETEPIAKDNPLMQCDTDRLFITPHIAWASKEARVKLLEGILHNIQTYLETI